MAKLSPIYADYNSTTPLCDSVVEAFLNWQRITGNMSSAHYFGQQVHGIYDDACDVIKELLGARSFDLFSCGSATEANYWWLYSLLNDVKGVPRIISTVIEHPCVMEPLLYYAEQGRIDLQLCPVGPDGVIDMDVFKSLLNESTLMVSVMYANNEIGTIQPMADVVQAAKSVGALVHSDMVQAAGKLRLDLDNLGVDAVSLSAHKCYAPTGCGGLMVRDKSWLRPLFLGGSQQQKLRAGTVNVMGMDLFSKGLTYCYDQLSHHLDIHAWGRELCQRFKFVSPIIQIKPGQVLWNTLPLAISNYISHDAMMRLDMLGVAVATGSACSTGAVDISPVISALNLSNELSERVVRLSFGYPTTSDDLIKISDLFVSLETNSVNFS
ncbi:MAG: aminotransferase class V-fold PLP-dependent enzyme [Candidatus Margulisiibacteriota bacterium]